MFRAAFLSSPTLSHFDRPLIRSISRSSVSNLFPFRVTDQYFLGGPGLCSSARLVPATTPRASSRMRVVYTDPGAIRAYRCNSIPAMPGFLASVSRMITVSDRRLCVLVIRVLRFRLTLPALYHKDCQ